MTDYLGRLAERVVSPENVLRPRVPSRFELVEESSERVVWPSAAPVRVEAPAQPPPRAETRVERAHESAPPEPRVVVEERVIEKAPIVVERVTQQQAVQPAQSPQSPIAIRQHFGVRRLTGALHRPLAAVPVLSDRRATALQKNITIQNETRVQREHEFIAQEQPQHRIDGDVHVTIGRIDVRAVIAPQAARDSRRPQQPRTLSLDDYLTERSRR